MTHMYNFYHKNTSIYTTNIEYHINLHNRQNLILFYKK